MEEEEVLVKVVEEEVVVELVLVDVVCSHNRSVSPQVHCIKIRLQSQGKKNIYRGQGRGN